MVAPVGSRKVTAPVVVSTRTDNRSVVMVIWPAAVDIWVGVSIHLFGDVARLARVKNAALGAQATRMMSAAQTSIFNMPQLTLRTGMLALPPPAPPLADVPPVPPRPPSPPVS